MGHDSSAGVRPASQTLSGWITRTLGQMCGFVFGVDVMTNLKVLGAPPERYPAYTLKMKPGRKWPSMPLYGHELDETIDPLTAGLDFAVKLRTGDFIGKDALTRIAADESRRRRVGLELQGRRIAREGALLFSGDDEIGRVTSGTFSPTLEKAIAMGYVEPGSSDPGTDIEVDIRGKRQQARVVALPFYRRT